MVVFFFINLSVTNPLLSQVNSKPGLRPDFFLLADLQDFFQIYDGGGEDGEKKLCKMTS